ncbi:MAG TPA: alcohol dehydrogenase catalytic domain-containing protein [Candidatus Udaeobacter sp.]|nr:alcohol dehydrogenase catalytic domain-containing protein [Candidatus Udaeobacter sp.]
MANSNLPATMKAAIMTKPLEIIIEELPVPQVGIDEVLVKVMAVGICGSDIHYYEHGKLAIVGLPAQEEIPLNVPSIADNEFDIYGVFRYANTYPSGIAILTSGLADIQSLITDRYPLSQTQEAMERARTNKSGSLKVIIYPNEQF